MISKYKTSLIPNIKANKGAVISCDAFLDDISPFLFGFKDVKRDVFITKYSNKRYPYTGKKYLNIMFQIFDMKHVIEVLSIFGNELPIEVLFINKIGQINNRRRIDNPKTKFPEYFKDDIASLEKLRIYNQKEFGEDSSNSNHLELIVGKTGESTYCFFDILYVLNLEDINEGQEDTVQPETGLVSGELIFRYHFQTSKCGIRQHEKIIGDDIGNKSFQVEQKEDIINESSHNQENFSEEQLDKNEMEEFMKDRENI